MREIGHFIGGKEVKGTSGRFGDVFNPNTGEVQAKVAFASRAEVEQAIASAEAAQAKQRGDQAALLRDIFGNPFRPSPPLPPAVLGWSDGTVRRLAQAAYEERLLPAGTLDAGRLGILADALLDAGCDDEGLLAHLRSNGPHVRGCWALDLILGRS